MIKMLSVGANISFYGNIGIVIGVPLAEYAILVAVRIYGKCPFRSPTTT
jgi:hypothetical protein